MFERVLHTLWKYNAAGYIFAEFKFFAGFSEASSKVTSAINKNYKYVWTL